MEIYSSYPAWFYLLCCLAGAGASALLYFNLKQVGFGALNKGILSVLRFLAISLLCFLLLNPFVKTERKQIEKPIVLVAQDNSSSILLTKDSSYFRTLYLEEMSALGQKLGESSLVKQFSFGQEVRENISGEFSDNFTDFQQLFTQLDDQFVNQNVKALILSSDGIYNKGIDPNYLIEGLNIPIYTIALGDTNKQNDVLVSSFRANSFAYLGNDFPLEAEVEVNGFENKELKAELLKVGSKGTEVLSSRTVKVDAKTFRTKLSFKRNAKDAGLRHFRIRLSSLNGEINYSNNSRDLFIEVLDSKKKILLIANSPHPDIKAIKTSLEKQGNAEVKVRVMYEQKEMDIAAYDLLVFHQIPNGGSEGIALINEGIKRLKPALFIIGGSSNINQFNSSQKALKISNSNDLQNVVQAHVSKDFKLFSVSETLEERITKWPPIRAPFGEFKTSLGSFDLLRQKIGSVQSDLPLLSFYKGTGPRQAVFAAESFWKWKMAEYEEHDSHEGFDELISKTVQFLTVKQDKRPFRLKLDKNIYDENEAIKFYAELFNSNYELETTPEVAVIVKSENGEEYTYSLGKTSQGYFLNAGKFSDGKYQISAKTVLNGETYSASSNFVVKALDYEGLISQADHQLLNRLATASGGKMFQPDQTEELAQEILSRADFKPLAYYQSSIEEIINWRWLLGLIALLLGVEWFIRKFKGAY